MQHRGQAGTTRFALELTAIREAVLETSGDTERELREAAFTVAAGEEDARRSLPSDVEPFVEKIARHAWKVTDDDFDRLKRAGWSEDAIFELVVATAAGAGLGRLERALAAFAEAGGKA